MWFWVFMFICNLLVPLLMVIFGRVMFKHPPQDINDIIGYRTAMSKKNKDTWYFANQYCGRIWWKTGWILLIPSIAVQLPFLHSNDDIVSIVGGILCTVQITVLLASIIPVERALKQNFNPDGTRK